METAGSMAEKGILLVTEHGLRVLGVLVALVAAWVLAGWARTWVTRALDKAKLDLTLAKFLGNVTRYVILIFIGLGCLGVFGIETTSFAALIAGAGLAIGLAFQGTLSNLAAGFMLLIFRPFKVGQYITVAGVSGIVEEIALFTTSLNTLDNRRLIVPNGSIFGSTIENFAANETRRVDVPVGVAYDADIDRTREVLEQSIKSLTGMLNDPAPQIFLAGLGASSVDWQVRVWAKTSDYWNVYQEVIRSVKNALDQADIGIPFPQMDVHFDRPLVESMETKKRSKEAHA